MYCKTFFMFSGASIHSPMFANQTEVENNLKMTTGHKWQETMSWFENRVARPVSSKRNSVYDAVWQHKNICQAAFLRSQVIVYRNGQGRCCDEWEGLSHRSAPPDNNLHLNLSPLSVPRKASKLQASASFAELSSTPFKIISSINCKSTWSVCIAMQCSMDT